MSALLGGAWASLGGRDVCPECQTRSERADLARQVISAIEAEVNRSAALDPSPVEPGLVLFAMQLREALAAYEESASLPTGDIGPDEPTGPVHVAELKAGTNSERSLIEFDVAITGAFLTGSPLRIGIDEYADLQAKLSAALSEYDGHGWRNGADQLREGTYHSGGGFAQVLPLVLVWRGGPEALARAREILDGRPRTEHNWLDQRIAGWTFEPTSMRIEVYDLGVAVINGTFRVGVPAQTDLALAARTLKETVWLRPDAQTKVGSPIAGMFRKLSKQTTRQFRTAVAASVPEANKLQSWLPASASVPGPSAEWGRLMWLHPVHMVSSADPSFRRSTAKAMAPAFYKCIKVPDGQFVSGIGWSAIITDRDESARDVPMKLLQLHWAYIALYMEIDRGLLVLLDKDGGDSTAPSLLKLEQEALKVFNDYLRVMKARARVDTALAGLGGDEQAIWDAMTAVTKFDVLVDGVDRKVEVLQKIAERRVQQATSEATRRTARILGFLTTLALVTLSVTLLGYFFGGFSDDDRHHHLRWLFLTAGIVSAGIVWYLTFAERRSRAGKRKIPSENAGRLPEQQPTA